MDRNQKRIALLDEAIAIIEALPDDAVSHHGWTRLRASRELVLAHPAGWLAERKLGGLTLAGAMVRHPEIDMEDNTTSHVSWVLDIPFDWGLELVEDPYWDRVDGAASVRAVWLHRARDIRTKMLDRTLPFFSGEMP